MKKSLIILCSLLILLSCSSEKDIKKGETNLDTEELYTPDLKANFKEVFSWVNLMPGPEAKPRFNITGEIEILESSKYDIKFMNLALINIYQNDEMIYSIDPVVRTDENRSTEKMKYVIFSTIKGLLLNRDLDINNPVDVKFIFKHDNDTYSYFISSVKIEKAY